MAEIAVKVEGVCKKYCKSLRRSFYYGISDVSRNIFGLRTYSENLRKDEFWVLEDISYELKRGEVLGIIGPNGSGKTTLLKMLNGIFWPDKGKITIKGRVGALIELGAGFHPAFSGRENIYINGAILGMRKKEIDNKLDAIVDFAGIGDFLDVPVKHYSSGMFMRLGFSIAVHSEPEVLLIDEILAVGDRNFQIKCFRKIHELKRKNDIALIIVSHNEYTMRVYAKNCIVLDGGRIIYYGSSEEAISFYVNKFNADPKDDLSLTTGSIFEHGILKRVEIREAAGNPTNIIPTGDRITVDFEFNSTLRIRNPIFGITFLNEEGEFTGLWSSYANTRLPDIEGEGKIRVTVDNFALPVGNYNCYAVLCEGEESNVVEWKDLPAKLIVERSAGTYRYLKLRQKWELLNSRDGDSNEHI